MQSVCMLYHIDLNNYEHDNVVLNCEVSNVFHCIES